MKEAETHLKFEEKLKQKANGRGERGVECLWNFLKESLLDVPDEVCGRTKGPPRHRNSWWWNDEVGKVVDKKRKLYKVWKKSNKEEDRVSYCSAKCKAKRAVYIAQSNEQKLFGEILDSEEKKGMVHRVVKQIVRKNRDVVGAGCIKGSNGRVLTNEEEAKERWRAYFEKLLNEEFEWDKDGLEKVD